MGRGALACRVRPGTQEWEGRPVGAEAQVEDLRDRLAEVEGWYRLLQADHSTLRGREERQAREAVGLRSRLNDLEAENKQLQDIVSRQGEASVGATQQDEGEMMSQLQKFASVARKYRWAAVAAASLAALAARDPWVNRVVGSAWETARDRREAVREDDGYVRYAAMVQAREQAEAARRDYNDREAALKGDALLEAQDRLRDAKARYRKAQAAFLPELARRCDAAGLPVPREAAVELAALKTEARD